MSLVLIEGFLLSKGPRELLLGTQELFLRAPAL